MTIMRTYTRLVVDSLDASLPLFESMTKGQTLRFPYGDWEVAVVGDFLLACIPNGGAPDYVVQAVCAVDDLNETLRLVTEHGAECLSGPKDVPTGRNIVARHADGLVIEYLELRPEFAERLMGTT